MSKIVDRIKNRKDFSYGYSEKNIGLYVLIAILCVLVLALGGYIVYDKIQNDKSSTTTTTDTTNSNTNALVSKLDNTKD